jgi:1,2-diacylglycerol 3-beta-galactosyltransferase
MNQIKRESAHVVFLFSDTGGGHRSAAQAIIEALKLEFPGKTTHEMVDIFRDYAPPPLHMAPELYPPLTRMQYAWSMGYHMIDGQRRARFFYQMLWPYIRWGVARLVRERPADLLVSVHQLINHPMARTLAATNNPTPFVTVVTDLVSTHAAWYAPQANMVVVPTHAAFERGITFGVSPRRMREIGLPVADRFCLPVDEDAGSPRQLRKRLGWPEGPVALLVGGGEGMGPLEAIAKEIDAARLPLSLVIIAGRNKKLKEKLERHKWRVPTLIYGFVQEMPDFMRAADVLVTKAGPGTISEAFIAGLPLVLYARLPGQEDGNVDYVVDHGAGVWAPRPEAVVEALRHWLRHPEERQKAEQACLRLARPRAARDIAHLLMDQIAKKG